MKVLKYGNRKEPEWFLDASTPEKEVSALRCLFLHLKHNWHAYADMEDIDSDISKCEKELQDLEALKLQLPTIPEMLRQDAEKKLEQLPRLIRHVKELKWQKEDWQKVQTGNPKALKHFLESRSNGEYEEWEFVELDDPDEYIKKHFADKQ